MAENTENTQEQTTPGTGEASTAKASKEKTPAQLLKEERIKEVKAALKSFPTLKEGFVTPRGVYFDEESALLSVDGDEELVTKVQPSKK
ncbi:hypothetical protein [Hymenobacter tenuis]